MKKVRLADWLALISSVAIMSGVTILLEKYFGPIAQIIGGIVLMIIGAVFVVVLYFFFIVFVFDRCPKGGRHHFDQAYGPSKFYKGSRRSCIKCGRED